LSNLKTIYTNLSFAASPNSDLAAGQLVTMTGLNFGLSTAGNIVTVGSYITTISSYSHTSIVFAMPNANGLNLPVQIALGKFFCFANYAD
jgi:hypothetical protein